MILDPPKLSLSESSSPSETVPLARAASPASPSVRQRDETAEGPSPEPPDRFSIERIRYLIETGQTDEVLLAQTELLASIFDILSLRHAHDVFPPAYSPSSTARRLPPAVAADQPFSLVPDALSLAPPRPEIPFPRPSSSSAPESATSSPIFSERPYLTAPSPLGWASLPSPPSSPQRGPSPETSPPRPLPPVMGPTFPDTSPASSPAQSSISASSLKQTLKNHLSAHHVRFFSACQLRILELVSQKRSCVVEGGACEGKTTGMVASLLNEIIPAVRGPQVLLVAPTRTAAESLALLPHSFKSILIESFDPREDARKLARGQQHVVIGTPGRFVEMIRAREALQLGGVRWVGVEEGVWDSEAGRAAWDAVRQAGLPEDVKYVVISSPKSPAAAHEYINSTLSILGQPPSPIIGVSAVERIQSAGIRHICLLAQGPQKLSKLVDALQLLRSSKVIIFASSASGARILSRGLETSARVEVSVLNPTDSPAGQHVIYASERRSGSLVPLVTAPFDGHPLDEIEVVINWDVPTSCEEYLHRASVLDAHMPGSRLVVTITDSLEEQSGLSSITSQLDLILQPNCIVDAGDLL